MPILLDNLDYLAFFLLSLSSGSSLSPLRSSRADSPIDRDNFGNRLAPNNNNRISSIINSSGTPKPNIINSPSLAYIYLVIITKKTAYSKIKACSHILVMYLCNTIILRHS